MQVQPVILSVAKDPTIVRTKFELECDIEWNVRFLATLGMTNRARGLREQFSNKL
jgi:hypothetical protein